MRRRRAIAGLAWLAVSPALPAQTTTAVRIGFLSSTTIPQGEKDAFRTGLREHGYAEGRDVVVEWRAANGDSRRANDLAAELVRLPVHLIVTTLTPAARAARQATSKLPIVTAYIGDPVAIGLAKSFARPGGNVTGLSLNSAELSGKRVEIMRQLVPETKAIGLVVNGADQFSKVFVDESREPARRLGIELQIFDLARNPDIDGVFAEMKKAGLHAAMVQGSLNSRASDISASALSHRIALASPQRQFVTAGALMSYGPSVNDLVRRSAGYVDKILKGAKPADLPIEQPTKLHLVVNLKTATQLNLSIPPDLMPLVDETIQ